jgi:hypothetical protein
VFYSEKIHLLSKFKRMFYRNTGGEGPRKKGVEGFYKKVPFVIQVLMRMDKIQTSGE